jgi:uncharacterized protein
MTMSATTTEEIVAATRRWLERAVIGLNLCPFAAGPHRLGRVRFVVSEADTPLKLLEAFGVELRHLEATASSECETTLLIHPNALGDFLEYNSFLDDCDELIEALGLAGELQVASFHPEYQFADSAADDIENFTNRSPFPMLHLLREDSVSRAVESGDTEQIYERNIDTLRRLGREGWRKLWSQ